MNHLEVIQPPTFAPSDSEIEAERQYRNHMDRVSEFETWFVAQAEVQDEEDECSDTYFYDECRSAWDEYQELDQEYRRSIRSL